MAKKKSNKERRRIHEARRGGGERGMNKKTDSKSFGITRPKTAIHRDNLEYNAILDERYGEVRHEGFADGHNREEPALEAALPSDTTVDGAGRNEGAFQLLNQDTGEFINPWDDDGRDNIPQERGSRLPRVDDGAIRHGDRKDAHPPGIMAAYRKLKMGKVPTFATYYDYLIADASNLLDGQFQAFLNSTMPSMKAEQQATIRDWQSHLTVLTHPNTQRILMDSRQVGTFDAMDALPPDHWQDKLHSPFHMWYMEFDEPILVGEQEPGHEDYLRAILYRGEAGTMERNPEEEIYSDFAKNVLPAGEKTIYQNITFFLDNGEAPGSQYYESVDRSFLYFLNRGLPMTHMNNLIELADPSEVTEDYPPEALVVAGDPMGIENRYMGWWERTIIDYGSLVSWLMVYMMAKGIEIVVAPRSRAERRRDERTEFPKPWHVVRVEPRLVPDGGPSNESGITHGYRYDVMGHLRFGKHKLASGDYRQTIEWVPPHQRGLAHELYIPKTSKFVAGKETHPIMDDYFKKP